jgi:hypothetical protein
MPGATLRAVLFAEGRTRRGGSRRKSNEGGLSRDQTSLYVKIDIFIPVHGNGDYDWSGIGNKC